MRDFRDAKAMAQTLRETLNAKSVSLTHSESLELIARIFGCRDWNALAARIASAGTAPAPEVELSAPADITSGEPSRQKIAVAATVLDDYTGSYKFSDNAVFTVTREDDHLLARLTGQRDFPIYPHSPTEFFSEVAGARITFVPGGAETTRSLILHQGGVDYPMPRIEAATARQISSRTEEKVKSQSANPGTEAVLRRLIDELISGKPNYDEMSPPLAQATRQQLPNLQSSLAELRAVQSLTFLGVGAQGEDVYSVRHENGASHWRIALDSNGAISSAWVSPGP